MGKGRQAVPINSSDGRRNDGHAALCPSYRDYFIKTTAWISCFLWQAFRS